MTARQIARSWAEMVAGMVAGMVLLDAVWPRTSAVPVQALVMATDMSVGMAVVMLLRGHGPRSTLTMCAAMYAPFLLLLVPYSTGTIGADLLFGAGHVLMLGLMLLLVCRDAASPTHPAGRTGARPRPVASAERSAS